MQLTIAVAGFISQTGITNFKLMAAIIFSLYVICVGVVQCGYDLTDAGADLLPSALVGQPRQELLPIGVSRAGFMVGPYLKSTEGKFAFIVFLKIITSNKTCSHFYTDILE